MLLADDHEIVREGLISLLSEAGDVEVVGEATNGREAVNQAYQLRPDVVIMDVAMPLINGGDATRQIKKHLPWTRVIALSMYEEAEVKETMYRAGAESYVLKTAPTEELLGAIRGRAGEGGNLKSQILNRSKMPMAKTRGPIRALLCILPGERSCLGRTRNFRARRFSSPDRIIR